MRYMNKREIDLTIISKNTSKKLNILEIIHTDLCESVGKAKYFVTLINEATRWCKVQFLKTKHEIFEAFKEVKTIFEILQDKKISFLRTRIRK